MCSVVSAVLLLSVSLAVLLLSLSLHGGSLHVPGSRVALVPAVMFFLWSWREEPSDTTRASSP